MLSLDEDAAYGLSQKPLLDKVVGAVSACVGATVGALLAVVGAVVGPTDGGASVGSAGVPVGDSVVAAAACLGADVSGGLEAASRGMRDGSNTRVFRLLDVRQILPYCIHTHIYIRYDRTDKPNNIRPVVGQDRIHKY